MATVLVVDDSPLDRRLAARILEEVGFRVACVEHGKQAIAYLDSADVDLVLTDLQMPEMDGLALVRKMTSTDPTIPVILMTAFGSEEIAVAALQKGAASYVPKQNLKQSLVETVKNVLSVARARRETRTMLDSMTRLQADYVLPSSLEGLDSLIGYVKEQLRHIRLLGEADILRVGTALYEALVNAIEHGNLELRPEDRDQPSGAYRRLMEERASQAPYRSRHVYLTTTLSRMEAVFLIRDQGPGFDTSTLPDPTAPDNVDKVNGRGLFLIRTFMDEVRFNDTGNELTMLKRRTAP